MSLGCPGKTRNKPHGKGSELSFREKQRAMRAGHVPKGFMAGFVPGLGNLESFGQCSVWVTESQAGLLY